MPRPDIFFFFSDQHHGRYTGYAGHDVVETPNLDRIAADGTSFGAAYTPCPLCVPGRSGMLTGQLPSRLGIFGNFGIIPSDQATFLHSLGARGYETVLCGRMHFKGADQRHGFTRRIFGDVTHFYRGGIDGLGHFDGTVGMGGCVDLVGAGNSPVLEYDRQVVQRALEYLSEDHDKPQCIVLGTYGPHFPYIAPPELYEYYRPRVQVPESWDPEGTDPNPVADSKRQRTRYSRVSEEKEPVTEAVLLGARAAYMGMITQLDRQIGQVRDAWGEYLERSDREGLFIYSSDHGDTCGEHGIFGKQNLYEGGVRVPLVVEGHGVRAGSSSHTPASIMDIGPTLCELTGTQPPPSQDGRSLLPEITEGAEDPDRPVLSEWVQGWDPTPVPMRAVRRRRWKLICSQHSEIEDQLFDLETDPAEVNNRAEDRPEVVAQLENHLEEGWEPERLRSRHREQQGHHRLISAWTNRVRPPEPETWRPPEEALQWPEIAI